MGDLDRDTYQWISRVRYFGYNLEVIYECEWRKLVDSEIRISEHIKTLKTSKPITPRDALYGGRTEAFSAYSGDGKVIRYFYFIFNNFLLFKTLLKIVDISLFKCVLDMSTCRVYIRMYAKGVHIR